MKVLNTHERSILGDAEQARQVFDSLGRSHDRLWPRKNWPALRLDAPKEHGGRGGHGPIHYRCLFHESGKRTVFEFEDAELSRGLCGTHFFELLIEEGTITARHVIDAEIRGPALFAWPLFIRPMHDALIEEALDNFEKSLTGNVKQRSVYSPYVRVLRFVIGKSRRLRAIPRP